MTAILAEVRVVEVVSAVIWLVQSWNELKHHANAQKTDKDALKSGNTKSNGDCEIATAVLRLTAH